MSRKKILIPIIIFTAIIILLIIMLTPNTSYNKISINKNKWDSIKSSRMENDSLLLESIKFNDYNLIIDEDKNTVYYSLVNDNKTKYNPDVSFIASDENAKLAILSDEITNEKLENNYEFKIIIYNKSNYHIYNLICMDLPILNITFDYKQNQKEKNIQAQMYLFNNLSNTPNRITKSRCKLDIMEDGEYKLSLTMFSPGKNKRKNNLSLFNMKPEDEYMLYPIDNVENMEKIIDNYNVELFINNKYIGLYTIKGNSPEQK